MVTVTDMVRLIVRVRVGVRVRVRVMVNPLRFLLGLRLGTWF